MDPSTERPSLIGDALVAIIDDSELSLEITAAVVEDAGYSVETTFDEATAVDWAEQLQPDLLLVDLTLSDGSGTQLVAKLKQRERLSCPIVIYSGHDESFVSAAAKECGADGYALKGGQQDFVAQIRHLIAPRGRP